MRLKETDSIGAAMDGILAGLFDFDGDGELSAFEVNGN